MDAKIPPPKRLSFLLTLVALVSATIFLGTVLLVAERLASQFDADARSDVEQRVERGLEYMLERLEIFSEDYGEWTAAYEAIFRQDKEWLTENVGTDAYLGGSAHLIVLGGGPLEQVMGWSDASLLLDRSHYDEIYEFGREYAARTAFEPGDYPIGTFLWFEGELWMLVLTWSAPHTSGVELVLPTAMMISGVAVEMVKARSFSDTLLFSDVQISVEPGLPGATQALEGVDGPVAWLTWTPPRPGTNAIMAVAVPVGFALGGVLVALAFGTYLVRRLAIKLERALIEAQAATLTKSAFLANMSHEIRTPLNGVLGMADILADTPLKKDQREMLATIRDSGWSLLSLINDILDLSRVESGKLSIEARPFDLAPLIERVESLHGATAKAKGLTLVNEPSSSLGRFRLGDEARITQILHNIMGNAVKFTEKGSVTLQVDTDRDDELVFCVRDTGVGMTEEQISRIFEAFEQAEVGTSRRFGGTGLGMSIVRRLVGVMGGEISVTSEPGMGTEVTIRLPVPAIDPIPDLRASLSCDQCAGSDLKDQLRGFKLLVAEDNASNRKILALMLDALGIEAQFATNGAEACEAWRAQDFDLLLLDISMPIMDGLEAMRVMQRESAAQGRLLPRVIAATANVMKEQTEIYRAKGFVDVLAKPVRREALLELLVRHLLGSKPVDPQGPT